MKTIYLESSENSNSLIITGDIDSILSNRRATRYLRDTLQYTKTDISIVINIKDDISKSIDRVKKICKYVSAELIFSGHISRVIENYVLEEKKFDEFSEKARSIRNNQCDKEDFQVFIDSVSRNLNNRSLYELQLLSAYHLAFSQNACNFSVPGAGKTSVVYGAFAYLSNLPRDNKKYVDKLLIISPLSAFGP